LWLENEVFRDLEHFSSETKLSNTSRFILLFDWPIFDLKDLYILFAIITIIFYYFAYRLLHFRKLSKKEQKRITDEEKFLYWVKCGLPSKQKT